ncbi:hypothetical protein HYV43_01585 [Candidatus Micrarchaeota archaeon]|nr:hypothetical protein [Candidatus Micrarchaeota archaeon]
MPSHRPTRIYALALAALVLVVAAVVFSTPRPAVSSYDVLPDWKNASGWVNTAPLNWSALSGKPTLVYFWSATCERCLEGLPTVDAWASWPGLNVVFVHAPEFAAERDALSATQSIRRLGIRGPVALDHAGMLWNSYSQNRSQDIFYVVAANGSLEYSSSYVDSSLDAPVRRLSEAKEASFSVLPAQSLRRIYTGYLTSVLGVRRDWAPNQEKDYVAPVESDVFIPYLVGRWSVGLDSVRASGPAQVVLRLLGAKRLYVVAESTAPVRIFQMNRPLVEGQLGRDVGMQDGDSVLHAYSIGAYELARNLPDETEFVLEVPAGFTLYRFTLDG